MKAKAICNLTGICTFSQQLKEPDEYSLDMLQQKFLSLKIGGLEIVSRNASNQDYKILWLVETIMSLKENK